MAEINPGDVYNNLTHGRFYDLISQFIDMYRKLGGMEQLKYARNKIYSYNWRVIIGYTICVCNGMFMPLRECVEYMIDIERRDVKN